MVGLMVKKDRGKTWDVPTIVGRPKTVIENFKSRDMESESSKQCPATKNVAYTLC